MSLILKPNRISHKIGLCGALILVNSFYHGAMPSVAVNAFWIAIALFALTRVRWRSRRDEG